MVLSFVFILAVSLAFSMSMMIYPLALGGVIFLMSLVVLMIISVDMSVFFGLVLLLIFVGGLLVAFGYAVALASNPVFGLKTNKNLNFKMGKMFFSFCFIFVSVFGFFIKELSLNFDLSAVSKDFQSFSILTVSEGWGVMVLFLGVLLFISMVGVVSMCFFYKGALVEFKRVS